MLTRSYHIKRQSPTAPESDTYPVANDGSGPRPFAGTGIVARTAGERDAGERRQTTAPPEADVYPVSNDGSGPRPFAGVEARGERVRRQATAPPEADVYPVKNDGSGSVPL